MKRLGLALAFILTVQAGAVAWAQDPASSRVDAIVERQIEITQKDRQQFDQVLGNTLETLDRVEKELSSGHSAFPNSFLSAVTGVGLGVGFVALGLFLGGDNTKLVGPIFSTAGIAGFALVSAFSAVANIMEVAKEKEMNAKLVEEAKKKSEIAQKALAQAFLSDPENGRKLQEVSKNLMEVDRALLAFTQSQTSTSRQTLITVALQSLGVSIIVSSYILDERLGPYTATVTWTGLLTTQIGNINRLLLSANKDQKKAILAEVRLTRLSIRKIKTELSNPILN